MKKYENNNGKTVGAELCNAVCNCIAQFKLKLYKPASLIHSQPTWLTLLLNLVYSLDLNTYVLGVGQIDVWDVLVGNEKCFGSNVKNGFFKSIQKLKTINDQGHLNDVAWTGINIMEDYRNILDICQNKIDLPSISL